MEILGGNEIEREKDAQKNDRTNANLTNNQRTTPDNRSGLGIEMIVPFLWLKKFPFASCVIWRGTDPPGTKKNIDRPIEQPGVSSEGEPRGAVPRERFFGQTGGL